MRLRAILMVLIVGTSSLGCGMNRQYLRLVGPDVYEGVQMMGAEATHMGAEAQDRYFKLHSFAKDMILENGSKLGASQEDIDLTIADLDAELVEFGKVSAQGPKIHGMSRDVLYGLGWYEGPRDPLPTVGALAIGAAAGAAAVAAF